MLNQQELKKTFLLIGHYSFRTKQYKCSSLQKFVNKTNTKTINTTFQKS